MLGEIRTAMDLSTRYLGLTLVHPFIAGASPLGDDLDSIRRLEDGGAAAIVLRSIFEEQITMVRSGRIHHMEVFEPQFQPILESFPKPDEVRALSRPVFRAPAAGQRSDRHSDPCLAQRTDAGIVADDGELVRRSWSRGAGTEPLRSRDRRRHAGGGYRRTQPASGARAS